MGFFDPPKRPVDIKLLNVENDGSKAMISYKATYADKSSKNIRINVKYLSTYFWYSGTGSHIIKAECLGKVYIGLLKNDVRLLFLVTLSDRTMDLLQAKEGTNSCNTLLAKSLGEDQHNSDDSKTKTDNRTLYRTSPAEPYKLNQNELPQGRYDIGKDIPAGYYDFFVVYGSGGSFNMAVYDENDKAAEGTYSFYWVGLEKKYEKRELIHVQCKEGYSIIIRGNVILKIAKSNSVRINL
jgi:hypothetical protein